jgi:hypothetical protein
MPELTPAKVNTLSVVPSTALARWSWLLAVALVILAGCASTQAPGSQPASVMSGDLQRVGPLRVLLRPQPEVELICRLHAQRQGTPGGRILGCYIPAQHAIVSTADAQVLLHEFRHYFEGALHD